MQEPRPVYIYILREHDVDEVRYVGQTVNTKMRLRAKLSSDSRGKEINARKTKWIKGAKEKGKTIQMVVIETCNDDNANEREGYWIRYYLEHGHRLTNGIDEVTGKHFPREDGRVIGTVKQDFRVTYNEKDEYKKVCDFAVKEEERGQRGTVRNLFFGWMCSRNPNVLRKVAQRLSEYADKLESE